MVSLDARKQRAQVRRLVFAVAFEVIAFVIFGSIIRDEGRLWTFLTF